MLTHSSKKWLSNCVRCSKCDGLLFFLEIDGLRVYVVCKHCGTLAGRVIDDG